MLEKLLTEKRQFSFQGWQIILGLTAAVLVLVGFGAAVLRAETKPGRAGFISKTAHGLARIPSDTKAVFSALSGTKHPAEAREQRFEGQAGFSRLIPATGDEGLLLLSRFDGDRQRGVVEVLDLGSGDVLHTYMTDGDALHRATKARVPWVDPATDKDRARFFLAHPLATDDGGLVFHSMYTAMAKLDVCSRTEWVVDDVLHHSIEMDDDSSFWTGGVIYPSTITGQLDDFEDDAIVHISADGEILSKRSIADIAIKNGLKHQMFVPSGFPKDPFHLNDIQPVTSDGPFWQEGDLFLSLRHPSAIWLYRPSTDEIIWRQEGPWMLQHDVDILSDTEIAVFDNNAAVLPRGARVMGTNRTVVFDLMTKEASGPFDAGYERHDIRTVSEGRSEILPGGTLFVEEQNHGRALALDTEGNIVWQYVNRASDGKVYQLRWSRYVPPAQAADLRQVISNANCSSG